MKESSVKEPLWYRPKDAAKLVGVSRGQLYRWFKRGLSFMKMDGAVLINKEDLLDFIHKNAKKFG